MFNKEQQRVRDLAREYVEYAASDEMKKRRFAWSEHNALNFTTPLIYIRAIPFEEFFDYSQLQCTDSALRELELGYLQARYHRILVDDFIYEPYKVVQATLRCNPGTWNVPVTLGEKKIKGGAAAYEPVLIEESDISRLSVLPHSIDEEATASSFEQMQELLGDIMPVFVDRQGALCRMWECDISTTLAKIRGLEQIMWDAYDRPEWLHSLLSLMRDAILKNMDECEAAGDFSFLGHQNQAMPYMRGLERPGGGKCRQSQLWGYMASQEYTTFGPDMFKEFMFDYQKTILERYAVTAYGCCEDLTNKISVIKELKNLRRIAVSPFANLEKCAQQIGGDYIFSWRPNPSDMVSQGVDEDYVRRYIKNGIRIMKEYGCKFDITLKDVETVSGHADAIPVWTSIVRDELDRAYR